MLRLAPDSFLTEGGRGEWRETKEGNLGNGSTGLQWRPATNQKFQIADTAHVSELLTISNDAQDGKIHQTFPVWSFLQGDTITCSGKDVTAANGHQLTTVVSARHVVQHRCVIDESIQLAVRREQKEFTMKTSGLLG